MNMYENYQVASRVASQSQNITNKRVNMRDNIRDTPKPNGSFYST